MSPREMAALGNDCVAAVAVVQLLAIEEQFAPPYPRYASVESRDSLCFPVLRKSPDRDICALVIS